MRRLGCSLGLPLARGARTAGVARGRRNDERSEPRAATDDGESGGFYRGCLWKRYSAETRFVVGPWQQAGGDVEPSSPMVCRGNVTIWPISPLEPLRSCYLFLNAPQPVETAAQEGDGRGCLPCEKAWHAGRGPRVLIQRLRAAAVHERSFHDHPHGRCRGPLHDQRWRMSYFQIPAVTSSSYLIGRQWPEPQVLRSRKSGEVHVAAATI